ncbi:MAG TPA: hypothetical protein VGQ11_00420 [Candidatus Acidoferrales bacterium]|nr:hypothetical protein [Candidatus Acidoferrales bacterium]
MRANFIRISLAICGLAALGVAVPPALAQREPAVQKELLERVGDWADNYVEHPPSFAAEETLSQKQREKRGGVTRTIVSDYYCLRLSSSLRDRSEFRDVLSVDGRQIQSDTQREAKWAKLAATQSWKDFSAQMEGPEKYELAPEQFSGLDRLASRFATRYQDRMHYFYAQDTSDVPSRNVLIGYRQFSGEGLAVVDGKAVLVAGQAWVDPDSGRIQRIEEQLRTKNANYWIAVDFAAASPLDAWLPASITVRVVEKGRIAMESVYEYSNFRSLPLDVRAASTAKP